MFGALFFTVMTVAQSAAPAQGATVTFAGDVTLGFHSEEFVDTLLAKGTPRDEALGWGFARVRDVTTRADLFVVNLECPFTGTSDVLAKNFTFKARPQLVEALLVGGVDLVSLANNHSMDFQAAGLFDTLATLDLHGLGHFGAGRDLSAAREPVLVSKNGVRFAFLGYFFLGERNIEPREVIATDTSPGVAGHFNDLSALKTMVAADVRAAKANADHVVVFFHWGREGQSTPEPYQVDLGHFAVDQGTSVVVGSHPHVLQGIEWYRGAPIAYSLGNFVFGGNWNPKDKRTALLNVRFSREAVGEVTVTPALSDDAPEHPIQPYFPGDGGVVLDHLRTLSKAFDATIPHLR